MLKLLVYRMSSGCVCSVRQNVLNCQLLSFSLKVWNIITGRIEKDFVCHQDTVLSCDISPDATKYSSTSADKTAKVGQSVERCMHKTLVFVMYYESN